MTKPELLPYEALFEEIAHGDQEHRAWLLEALRTSPALAALTRPATAPDVGLVGEELFAIEPQSGVAAGVYYWIPEGLRNRILTALSASGTGWRALRTDEPDAWEPVLAWCVSEDDREYAEVGEIVQHQWLVANRSDIQPGFWWQVGTLSRVYDVEGWLPLPPQEAGQ